MLDLAIGGRAPTVSNPLRVKGLLEGGRVGWFAPNIKYAEEVWKEVNEVLRGPLVARRDVQQKRVELINGGVLDFWTLHNTPDAGRGRAYDLALIDEAAMVPHLGVTWSRSIRPTLTDFGGCAVFGSTPAGNNFFRELFDRGVPGVRRMRNWGSWQLPTSTNPFISGAEIEEARLELLGDSIAFRTEYLAEFVDEFGALFDEPSFYDADDLPAGGVGTDATGCDFAYSSGSGDWTVFISGRFVGGVLYLLSMFRERVKVNEWGPELVGLPRPFAFVGGQERFVLDAISRDYGVFVSSVHTVQRKLPRAQPVIAAWNRGEVRVPSGELWVEDLVRECRAFTGVPGMDASDDIVDALSGLYHVLVGSAWGLPEAYSTLVHYAR
jgi:hypothetical protein